MIFLLCLGIYLVLGLCFTPFFTRCNFYDEINPSHYTGNEAYTRRQAKKAASKAYAQSLAWPVFLFIMFSTSKVLKSLDKYHEDREKQKEADRIVAEYRKENSWEAKFKALEAETKAKKLPPVTSVEYDDLMDSNDTYPTPRNRKY